MRVIVLMLMYFAAAESQFDQGPFSKCVNPNNTPGFCVPLNECESIMSVIYRQPLSQADREFIRNSECLDGYVSHFCCTTDTGFMRRTRLTTQAVTTTIPPQPFWDSPRVERFIPFTNYDESEQPRWPRFGDFDSESQRHKVPETRFSRSLLPAPPTCGGVTIENKIYGGSDAGLREFPWMVLLEYERKFSKNGNRIALGCSGSLINQRYVLTAAHCVRGAIEKKIGPLIGIRLGVHDTSPKVDCNGYGSCPQEITRVGFEELIPHELYKDNSKNKQYDIALIRLDRNMHFSESISPVCLPSALKARSNVEITTKAGTQLTAAGWGQTLQRVESPIKQKVTVPIVDHASCKRKFREVKVNVVDTQLCAGANFAEDSCTGDSGGPLMHFRGGVWVLEGIISFGYRCGLLGWPGVYTRVSSFDDWIRSNIRS